MKSLFDVFEDAVAVSKIFTPQLTLEEATSRYNLFTNDAEGFSDGYIYSDFNSETKLILIMTRPFEEAKEVINVCLDWNKHHHSDQIKNLYQFALLANPTTPSDELLQIAEKHIKKNNRSFNSRSLFWHCLFESKNRDEVLFQFVLEKSFKSKKRPAEMLYRYVAQHPAAKDKDLFDCLKIIEESENTFFIRTLLTSSALSLRVTAEMKRIVGEGRDERIFKQISQAEMELRTKMGYL